jgi:hypothetical protein
MAPMSDEPLKYLPLIPDAVLKQHSCNEPFDTRFRSSARLLQSIIRENLGLSMGAYVPENGSKRKIGSMITERAGIAGANFLTPEIAHVVRREVAYREIGAMIEEERLYRNLLSSMPLVFNAFVPLKQNLVQATAFLHEIIPGFSGTVTQLLFEHSPGRGNPKFTADYSAFDVVFRYTTPEGRRGFIAAEVKYSESMRDQLAKSRPRYDELSESCGLYIDPASQSLRNQPLAQLWREHLLAQSMIDTGLYDEGTFVFIAPEHNYHAQQAADLYAEHLVPANDGKARFHALSLEQVIEAIRLCDPDHAQALHRRYVDWKLVDGELELSWQQIGKTLPKVSRKPGNATAKRAAAPQATPRKGEKANGVSGGENPPF